MPYSTTIDERYIGFTSYTAGSVDVKDSFYDSSSFFGQLVQGTFAYGELTYDGLFKDVDIYDLGILSTGYYSIDVDDFTWDVSNFDIGSVRSFSLLNSFGQTLDTKYNTFTNIDFSVTSQGQYYVKISGSVILDAQYTVKYERTGDLVTNNPAIFGQATLYGSTEVGNSIGASITPYDADGNSDSSVGIGWYIDGVFQGLTDSSGSFTLLPEHEGKVLSFRFSFYDDVGNFEISNFYVAGTVTNLNDAPTGTVTITGTVRQGETVTANTSALADADGLGTLSYQWKADGTDISGATGNTYTLTQSEVGKAVTVEISYTDGGGRLETVASAATGAVLNANDAPTGSVTITGTPSQGQTLTATNSLADADGLGTLSYQWKADGTDIAGATGNTYTLTQSEVGKAVTVEISYTDGGGRLETVASAATGAVLNVNDVPTGSVVITGTPSQGQLLTASNTLADADGLGALSYQWKAAGTAISGATSSTYRLTQSEVGKAVTVEISYTDGGGRLETITSEPVDDVAGLTPVVMLDAYGISLYDVYDFSDALPENNGLEGLSFNTADMLVKSPDGLFFDLSDYLENGRDLSLKFTSGDDFIIKEAPIWMDFSYSGGNDYIQSNIHSINTDVTIGIDGAAYWTAEEKIEVIYIKQAGANVSLDFNNNVLVNFPSDLSIGTIAGSNIERFDLNGSGSNYITGNAFNHMFRFNGSGFNILNAGGGQDFISIGPRAIDLTFLDYEEGEWISLDRGWGFDDVNFSNQLISRVVDVEDERFTYFSVIGTQSSDKLDFLKIKGDQTVSQIHLGFRGSEEVSDGRDLFFCLNSNDAPTGSVVITGTPSQGQLLTASNTLADADGLGALSYQWKADGTAISGATSSTYRLTQSEVGKAVTVEISYTDGGGRLETIESPSQMALDGEVVEILGGISAFNRGVGENLTLEFYADENIIGSSVSSFDVAVAFNLSNVSLVSASINEDYIGFPNVAEDVVFIGGISLSGVSSSDPLFTLDFLDLNMAEDFVLNVSDVIVNGISLDGSTLVFRSSEIYEVSTSIVSRSGSFMSGVEVLFDVGDEVYSVISDYSGSSVASIESGSDFVVTATLDYNQLSKSVNSQDALDALRLSVGLDTQAGTRAAFDYIAADFNKDGKVTSQDALEILKYSVGLETSKGAGWIFVNSDENYSNISRANVEYEEGISVIGLSENYHGDLVGILIGDINDSYSTWMV